MKSLPLTNGRALQGIELLTAKETRKNMKPLNLINPKLSKPWLLISIYERLFDEYVELQDKLKSMYRKYGKKSLERKMWIQAARSNELHDKIRKISDNLRAIDEMIHNYIKNNNQPHEIKQTA